MVMLSALGIWLLLERRSNLIYWSIVALVIGFFGVQFYSRTDLQYFSLNVDDLAQRVLRALVTPVPWRVGEDYSFLVVPSICHWALMVPAFFGTFFLWRRSRFMRLLILYFVLIILFYGMLEDSIGGQDARYRVQVVFILALMQFHALWLVFKPVSAEGLGLAERRPFTSPIPSAPVGIRRIQSFGP